MFAIPFLIVFSAIPALFWFHGKRLLGSATHPAALFILAWFASSFVLSFTELFPGRVGALSMLWVIVNFCVFAMVKKIKAKRQSKSADDSAAVEKDPEGDKG